MSDVHSGGHIDGDGGVVDRRVEGVRATWQDVCYPKDELEENLCRNGESSCW